MNLTRHSGRCLAAMFLSAFFASSLPLPIAAQIQPSDSTSKVIIAHYMPWYKARPFSLNWGGHWTMNTFNPGKLKDGQPDIASHYHPLIGPYDSADPDVLEYHALLMRLAGIDGVILDWYGRENLFDYAAIHKNTTLFVERAAKAKLQFAICYEDQTIPKLVENGRISDKERVQHMRGEVEWLNDNWFRSPAYLKLRDKPLLLSFGQSGLSDTEWSQVLKGAPGTPLYLSEHNRRTAAAGAFDWPIPQIGLQAQDTFYTAARWWPTGMAVAFPRFHDIYEQAKIHQSWGNIPDDNGKTFQATLERALKSNLPIVQISTWNDWGEGTMIEPSVEFGYRDLEAIQKLRKRLVEPGFKPTAEDLRLPLRLYKLRAATKGKPAIVRELNHISQQLADLATKPAREAIERIEERLQSGG